MELTEQEKSQIEGAVANTIEFGTEDIHAMIASDLQDAGFIFESENWDEIIDYACGVFAEMLHKVWHRSDEK